MQWLNLNITFIFVINSWRVKSGGSLLELIYKECTEDQELSFRNVKKNT